MKQPATRWKRWGIKGILIAITLSWCVAAGRVIYYAGDYMIGFHPLLLLLLPYGFALGLSAVIGCTMGKWNFAATATICALIVFTFFSQMHRIDSWAWAQSIEKYDEANTDSIDLAAGLPELTEETLMDDLWNDEALPVLNGFNWYCEHHIASPGGKFRAFRYRGIVHVRIQKIRHGYRGIARVSSPEDIEDLEKGGQLVYESEALAGDHWVIWWSN